MKGGWLINILVYLSRQTSLVKEVNKDGNHENLFLH